MMTTETQTTEHKYELITRGLQEVLGGDVVRSVLAQGKNPKCYWGTTPTGRPHIGYLVPLTKMADFLSAGVEVTILLADVHAFLDNLKAPLELVEHRTNYYERVLQATFLSLGIPISNLRFVRGSSYQLGKEYSLDNYKLCATVTEHDAKKAGAEVVKQVDNPLLSGLLYPGLQALDEQYLGVDFQFGGLDQRKIFTFAESYLPRIGYAKRAHLMNVMIPGLEGGKMSASNPNSKIDLLDPPEAVRKKIRSAFCQEKNVDDNPVLSFVQAVLIPVSRLRIERGRNLGGDQRAEGEGKKDNDELQKPFVGEDAPPGTLFTIKKGQRSGGGSSHYISFEDLRQDFAEGRIHPGDLKDTVTTAILNLLEPIRQAYEASEEWKAVEKLAYPDPNAKVQKKKKEKVYHPPPPGKGKNAQRVEEPLAKKDPAPVVDGSATK